MTGPSRGTKRLDPVGGPSDWTQPNLTQPNSKYTVVIHFEIITILSDPMVEPFHLPLSFSSRSQSNIRQRGGWIITCVLEVWSETQTRYNHVRTGGSGQRRRLNIITCELEGRRYNHMRAGRSGQRRRLCSSVYVVWDHFKKMCKHGMAQAHSRKGATRRI